MNQRYRGKRNSPHKKWILLGITRGVVFISAVTVVLLFATGILGGRDDVIQTSTDMQSETGISVSDVTAQPTEQLTATPVITPSPTPEPTEVPVESEETGDSYFFNKYEIKNRNLLKKWESKKKK